MAHDLPSLTALRAFQAAGKHLSFQAAARELNVTPSAVSHQIRSLEEWLGTALFTRGARRIALTQAGRQLLLACNLSFARLARATQRLRTGSGRKLRVSALPLFTGAWLIPRLQRFEQAHPGIALEIETSNRIADLDRDEIDIAIRNLRSPTPGLVARKLLDIRGLPVCTPGLAAALETPADLAGQTLIHVSARASAWPAWLAQMGLPDLKARRNLSFDTVPAALQAAAQGHGVALGMDPIIWDSPSASGLVAPFPHPVPGESSYYIVHRRADGTRRDVKAFVDWVQKEMTLYLATVRRRTQGQARGAAKPRAKSMRKPARASGSA